MTLEREMFNEVVKLEREIEQISAEIVKLEVKIASLTAVRTKKERDLRLFRDTFSPSLTRDEVQLTFDDIRKIVR